MVASATIGRPGVVPAERWEVGSDFDLSFEVGQAVLPWLGVPHSLWGSGRHALRALLGFGRRVHGWRRLLAPSYYCHDVLAAARRELDVTLYAWTPFAEAPTTVTAGAGDVVLSLAPFGLAPTVRAEGGPLIEDHTHDPLAPASCGSRADYALASLRKTVPLPDGGVVWSPIGRDVPPEVPLAAGHATAALARLSAMSGKHAYLAGADVDKAVFRELAVRAERTVVAGPPSGISPYSRARLGTIPLTGWRRARRRNLSAFRDALGRPDGASLVATPFAATLVFATPEARDRVREGLIAMHIYPAVLWPLDHPAVDDVPAVNRALASRILSIHCDQRYGQDDMRRVAEAVREVVR
jgi:hypothetical protein